jgi:hypothetical protein
MGCLLAVNTLRFAENTLAKAGQHQLGALPLAAGMDMAHTLLNTQGETVYAPGGDELILNSLAGKLFHVSGDVDTQRITYVPANGATYLFFNEDSHPPLGATDRLVYTFADGTYAVRYHVQQNAFALPDKAITSDKGITFRGWKAESPFTPGATTSILTYWQIDSLLPERANWLLGPFVHVKDARGVQIANRDAVGVAGADWNLHDLYVLRITIPLPLDAQPPYTLEIGQYDGVHNLNAIFALPDGTNDAAIKVNVP